jgi:hypothetical protein
MDLKLRLLKTDIFEMRLILFLLILVSPFAHSQTGASAEFLTPFSLALNPVRERASCGDVDLRSEFARRNLPDRRHQDTTGWCYAFVGADLVSYELGQNISPADIARQYINTERPTSLASLEAVMRNPNVIAQAMPLGGGFTKKALEATSTGGFCLESEFPSEDYSWSAEQELAMMAKYPNKDRPMECLNADSIVPLFTGAATADLLSIVRAHDFRRILNRLPESVCRSRIPLPANLRLENLSKKGAEPFDHQGHDPFYQGIDDVLSGSRPVSLAIHSSVLDRPSARLRALRNTNHQVVLAGRRFNAGSGRCEYLIRNSDSSCQTYHAEYECENNHVWVPREVMRMGTFSADFISSGSAD